MTTTLDLKHPGKPGTLGAGLLHLDEEFKSKLKDVKGKIPSDLTHKFPGTHEQVINTIVIVKPIKTDQTKLK